MIRVITKDHFFQGEHDLVHALFECGLMELQVRKPKASQSEIENWVNQIAIQFQDRLVIYDHDQIINPDRFKGIHYASIDRADRSMIGYSRSCHSLVEVEKYAPFYKYLVLSPIYSSISKKGYAPKEDWDFSRVKDEIKDKLIALGGVSENKLENLNSLGFKHFALFGAVWESPEPLKSFKSILKKWENIARNY